MRWIVRIPVSIVLIAALGCSPAASTRPTETATGAARLPAWLTVATGRGAAALRSSAVIDGFRVHPDPGDDGVIHVFDDENVVVNGADIKADPPAQSYLVVNWGDGPNQRVGCGPCRQDHGYAPGQLHAGREPRRHRLQPLDLRPCPGVGARAQASSRRRAHPALRADQRRHRRGRHHVPRDSLLPSPDGQLGLPFPARTVRPRERRSSTSRVFPCSPRRP